MNELYKKLRKQFSDKVEVTYEMIQGRILIGPKDKPTFRFRLISKNGVSVNHLSLDTQHGALSFSNSPWDFTFHRKYTVAEAVAMIKNTYNVR